MRSLGSTVLFALATFTLTLFALWPRSTWAEPIADGERSGEWDEDGMKFGDIVVSGELAPDPSVPGGWVIVRTVENKSDAPATCKIEERIARTETMQGARVNPPPYVVMLRGVTITLAAHEKRKLGIPIAASIGGQITASERARTTIENAQANALAHERYSDPVMDRTYMFYEVQYLKPLAPGDTVAQPDYAVTRPMRMPGPAPVRLADGGVGDFL
jgi:hypothetical protein